VSGAFELCLATTNRGKLAELRALLGALPVDLVSLAQVLPGRPPPVEDGTTFRDNALIKARAAMKATMMMTLAEDAGLEVDALGGRPGVRSARYAGEGATDAENNAALLKALEEVDDDQRTARFRCVIVLLDPWTPGELVTEGRCEGRIARQPRGGGGFGYDPLFVVGEHGRTMAELDADMKNRVSHRARAVEALMAELGDRIARRIEAAARIDGI
jgi:XTP/dITP diphosphohydrolase